MYEARIENKNGSVYVLTGNESIYQVINIVGLNPPNAQINTTSIVGLDGAKFNSSKLETRNIVLTIKINGDIETNRLNLYNYFRTKEWCKFYYTNNSLNVSIEGYVETVECGLFTNNEIAQISILCPDPYFRSLTEIMTDISSTLSMFVFPFSINLNAPIAFSSYEESRITTIYNASESEIGVIIEINVSIAVSTITIKNTITGEEFTLNYSFQQNDRIIINTNKGQKSVMLIRNGVTTNLFFALQKGSTFFQLSSGMNLFGYLADSGESNEFIQIYFYHRNIYRGV